MKNLFVLVACLLPFSAAVGLFCPAHLVPLFVLVGLLAAVPLAAVIVGGQLRSQLVSSEIDAKGGEA